MTQRKVLTQINKNEDGDIIIKQKVSYWGGGKRKKWDTQVVYINSKYFKKINKLACQE